MRNPGAGGKSKGKGKGKKGKGGGKGNRGKGSGPGKDADPQKNQQLIFQRDGKSVCFKFNQGKPCPDTCNRLHICQFKGCGEKHPMKNCPKARAAGMA